MASALACLRLVAPLPLTGNAVVVAVHLCVWAVAEKISSFRARGHLRTARTAVATEKTGLRRLKRHRLLRHVVRSAHTAQMVAIAVPDSNGD